VISPVRDLLAPPMREREAKLDDLVREAHALHAGGWLRPDQRAAIRHLVEAHRQFGTNVDVLIPAEIRRGLGL
jgi:hypothetical protein